MPMSDGGERPVASLSAVPSTASTAQAAPVPASRRAWRFPSELWPELAAHLGCSDRARLRLVCREWALHLLESAEALCTDPSRPFEPGEWALKTPRVTALDIRGDLPAGGLSELSLLPSLRSLGLCHCGAFLPDKPPWPPALMPVAALTQLTHLGLPTGSSVTDGLLAAALPRLSPRLASVALRSCHLLTAAGVARLAVLRSLSSLDLTGSTGFYPTALSALTQLSSLSSLRLGRCHQYSDGATTAPLGALTRLTLLDLSYCGLMKDSGLRALTGLKALKHLDLRYCRGITDAGAVPLLAHLPCLTFLDLTACEEITDASLAAPRYPMPAMTHLAVWGCANITDAGLRHCLPMLPGLTHLDLGGCLRMTDKGAKSLRSLTSLRFLELWATQVTSVGLKALQPLTAMTFLDLQSTQITDSGLMRLTCLKSLTHLNVMYCDITRATVEHLEAHMPLLTDLCATSSSPGEEPS